MEQEMLIELVKQAQAGDRAAIEQLLTYAHTPVSYQCRKFMDTAEDAEDLTQEVLLVIYEKLNTLTEPAAFHGWVKRIAANRCMNARSRTHGELSFAEDEDGNSFVDTIEELDAQKIPDAAIDNAETSRMIVELIDGLPEAQRICTYLYYYDELSVKEIAKLTAATENTVKSRLNYARKAIKEGVLEHEKHGVKLYGLSPIPFLLHYLSMAAQAEANEGTAAACVTKIMAANAAAGAATAAATAQGAATATAAGNAAGHAVGFLSAKLIAGIVAGAVALGGIATAAFLLTDKPATPADPTDPVAAMICQHEWKEANCVTPKTCEKCGSTEGEALGHTWLDADCEHAKTCSVCGATEGGSLGHTWAEATCETPKTCEICGKTDGEALGHNYQDATCTTPATCTKCGVTGDKALGHSYQAATCTAPETCTKCGVTNGEALGHSYQDATCTAPKTCSLCGATEGSAAGHTLTAVCTACGKTNEEYVDITASNWGWIGEGEYGIGIYTFCFHDGAADGHCDGYNTLEYEAELRGMTVEELRESYQSMLYTYHGKEYIYVGISDPCGKYVEENGVYILTDLDNSGRTATLTRTGFAEFTVTSASDHNYCFMLGDKLTPVDRSLW